MARLKEYNGHYCESEYEYAFIGFLEAEGWKYTSGNKLSRVTKRDVLIEDDFKKFIADGNLDLTEDEVTQIYDTVRLVGAESDFATLHKVYNWLVDGIQFTPKDGIARMIPLINFEKDGVKNIFRVVNQFTVEYTNNGQKENRRPDVILFVNGMPLCIMELKNPADANATIYDAWEQINIRYWRDIPHLLHYCPLACIKSSCDCYTVYDYLKNGYSWKKYDLVILDECSTVCNEDVLNLFEKCNAEAYLLIGDIYQIEAIKFGNWFNFARYFVDKKSVYELVTPYRAKDKSILLDMWTCVRNFDENMFERLLANGFISTLNESIFERDDDEIVLCLGYDGLYGVNNINRYMQKINPSKPIEWGNWTYKVGDKVLFNESRRFGNVLYNNLKGSILSIDKKTDEIVFQILVDKIISERDVLFSDIKLIDCDCEGKSIVEFSVKRRVERDSDSDYSEQIVPFQIAYAVSIHKAQGLEYKSVKVVITEDIDEKISHNIFYTAITRTTDKLKIYMSKETQKKLAEKFVKSNVGLKQAQLFAGQAGLKLKNKLSS